MNEEMDGQDEELALDGAGAQLRRARENAGMSVEQLAAQTRIPQRHIETIEDGDYARLPSRTYAIGFSRSYAKAVGLDSRAITEQVREELAREDGQDYGVAERYEPGDPSRLPSRRLAWFAAFALVLLVIGAFSFYRTYFAPGMGPAPLDAPEPEQVAQSEPQVQPPGPQPIDPDGEVVFTSLEEGIWVKFYDASGDQLMQKQMALDESYTVPADADGPQVWTGRPDALRITIDGREIPKLAEEDQIVRDIPVTAEALLARDASGSDTAPAETQPSAAT